MQSTPLTVVGIVLLAVLSFTSGWFVGRTSSADLARIAQARPNARRAAPPVAAPRAPSMPERQPTPSAEAVQEVVVGGSPILGPENARVTIVEFSDFECPFCSKVNPALDKLRETYPNDVRVVFKHFPLPFHQNAVAAHKASIVAGEQGKFWEMHDWIFANRSSLDAASLRNQAEALGLDMNQYDARIASPELDAKIMADKNQGQTLGVRGTPSFFINGRMLTGAQPYDAFDQRVKEVLDSKG